MQEAGRGLVANEAKPAWARAFVGVMAGWATDNIQSMLDSEYKAAMGAPSEVSSHVLFEVEKEEVKMQLDGPQEALAKEQPGSTEVKASGTP